MHEFVKKITNRINLFTHNLPTPKKKVIGLIVVVSLAVALPVFIWAIVTLNFNPFERAASGEPCFTISGEPCSPTPSATAFPTSSPGPMSPSPKASSTPTSIPTPITSCLQNNQSVTLTPSSQTGNPGQTLVYTITVKNNNSHSCPSSAYVLSYQLPYPDWTAQLSNTVLTLDNGATGSAQLAVTSPSTAQQGGYPVGIITSGPISVVSASAAYMVAPSPRTPLPTATPSTSNHKPVISTSVLRPGYYKTPISATINGFDIDSNDSLSASIKGLPTGVTNRGCTLYRQITRVFESPRVNIACRIAGTPTVSGYFVVNVVIRDNHGATTSRNIPLLIIRWPWVRY